MAARSALEKNVRKPLVLVVDDDARVRESLAGLLSSAAIETLCFASAEALLSSNALAGARCLITDIRMPGMDGWEVHRQVSRSYPYILTILVSAFQEHEAMERAQSVGAFAFLFKPFDGEELLRTVEVALRKAATL